MSLERRFRRYALELPLHYRKLGEAGWLSGRSTNLSGSGVLFCAEQVLPTGAEVELRIALPVRHENAAPVQLFCSARIVRSESPQAPQYAPLLAAAILNYRLEPAQTNCS